VDGSNLGSEDTAPPFTLPWNTLKVTDAAHTLTAVARDAAGNTAESAPVAVTVTNAFFETFEDGSAANWVAEGLGSWAVATQNGNRVFRQSNNTVVANRAYLAASDWADQLVESDVTLNAASGNNRFFGVVARYRGPNDYYYFVLRTNHTAELKRLANGVAANVVAPRALPFTVTPGVTYRLTLEVVGSWLRAYVNGQLLMEGPDSTFASGRAGLLTYFSDVSFDNVHADPSPNAPVLP
jgi:pectate lyase